MRSADKRALRDAGLLKLVLPAADSGGGWPLFLVASLAGGLALLAARTAGMPAFLAALLVAFHAGGRATSVGESGCFVAFLADGLRVACPAGGLGFRVACPVGGLGHRVACLADAFLVAFPADEELHPAWHPVDEQLVLAGARLADVLATVAVALAISLCPVALCSDLGALRLPSLLQYAFAGCHRRPSHLLVVEDVGRGSYRPDHC